MNNPLKNWYKQLMLGKKLMVINAITTLTTLLLLMSSIAAIYIYTQRNQMLEQTAAQSKIFAESLKVSLILNDDKSANAVLSSLESVPDVEYAALLDVEGVVLSEYRKPSYQQNNDLAGQILQSDNTGSSYEFTMQHLLHAQLIMGKADKKLGYFVTQSSITPIYKQVALFMLLALAATALAAYVGIYFLNRMQKKLMAPLYKLIDVMHQVTDKNDYSQRAIVESEDEMGELAKGFNQMLGKVHYRERTLDKELKDKIEVEKRLDRLAHYDVTTHLPNRHYFNHNLSRIAAVASKQQMSFGLMFIDLDNFKNVNDTLGHHMGDALLLRVAEILKGAVRADDVVARLGGDEFGIILNDLSRPDDAAIVGKKINKEISALTMLDGNQISVGASIGISLFPKDAENVDVLLQNADTAMYYAKENGKNNFQFFGAEMRARTYKRANIETNLRKALENNELYVEYQPQFNTRTFEMTGVEALIRWNHPEIGMIRPDEFISIAEESGLIVPIGEWVLQTAAKQASTWRKEGLNLDIAVNISSRQFKESNLAQRFSAICKEAETEPAWIELELTESALLGNTDAIKTRLNELMLCGFKLTLDDFGTGYSSLAYLKRFPISKIKIDRSFVVDIEKNLEGSAITRAIIAMGKALDMRVIAEGIETIEQAQSLAEFGCEYGQGFLVSPAVNPQAVARLYAANNNNKQATKIKKPLDFSGFGQ
jgi:diguanylate cyclase